MEITYKRNLSQSYMILTLPVQYSGYQLHMCRQNKIANLLHFETMGQDGKMQFWYEITGMRSLEHLLESNDFSEELLVKMIETLVGVCKGIKPYLLEEEGLMLTPESIYVEHGTKQFCFAYCPGMQGAVIEGFRRLMEYLLTKINHADEQLVLASYEVYQQTTRGPYSLEDILHGLRGNRGGCDFSKKTAETVASAWEKSEQERISALRREESYLQERQDKQPQGYWKGQDKKILPECNIWEAGLRKCMTLLEKLPWSGGKDKNLQKEPAIYTPQDYKAGVEEQPTEYLGTERTAEGILRYEGVSDLPNITIDHVPFLLGSGEQADGVLAAQGISRSHARVTKEGEDYYIEDLNSMNGTWLNDQMLAYRQKEKLYMHDSVQLGREKFTFM